MYATWEVIVYGLVLNLPFLPLMLYPFRNKFRFGRVVTSVVLAVMEAVAVFVSYYAITYGDNSSLYNLIYGVLFAGIFLLLIDTHIGKIVFVLVMAYNCQAMAVTVGKYLEWLAVPAYAEQYYCWTYSVFIFIVEAILVPVVSLLFRTTMQKAMDGEHTMMWNYLWFVPLIFSVILSLNAYSIPYATEMAKYSTPHYVFSVVFMTVGMLFICYLILQFVQDETENAQIKLTNQALLTQNMQYENLSKRVEEANRSRHDLRHHLITLSSLAEKGDIEDIRQYLQQYSSYTADDSTLIYCENMTANALFVFYAQAAHESGIGYSVTAALPEQGVGVSGVDMTVVLGNLLENAIEACRGQRSDTNKWISVNAYVSGNALFLAVDNSYDGKAKRDKDGRFLSSKHEGYGIGIESVKSVVARYGGEFRAEEDGNKFCVSLMLYMPDAQEGSKQ